MVHSNSIVMGADVERVDTDAALGLGTKVNSTDGHDYLYVQASAAIGSNVTIIVTDGTLQAAAGAGEFQSPIAPVAINEYFWAKDNTLE